MTNLDNAPDPEDEPQSPNSNGDLGRSFEWQGKPLAPFSYNYRAALFRLTSGVPLTQYEHDPIFLYLLLQTPKRADALRSPAQITDFRLEVGEWWDRNRFDLRYNEARALVRSIEEPVAAAEELEPELPKGPLAPASSGNA